MLAILLRTPEAVDQIEARLEDMTCSDPTHLQVRDLILRHASEGKESLEAHISQSLGPDAVEKLCSHPHVALVPAVRRAGDYDLACLTLTEELAKLDAALGLKSEISEAAEDIFGVADETVTYRLSEAARINQNANRSFQEDQVDYQVGANGAPVNRAEKDAFDSLLENIGLPKGTSG